MRVITSRQLLRSQAARILEKASMAEESLAGTSRKSSRRKRSGRGPGLAISC